MNPFITRGFQNTGSSSSEDSSSIRVAQDYEIKRFIEKYDFQIKYIESAISFINDKKIEIEVAKNNILHQIQPSDKSDDKSLEDDTNIIEFPFNYRKTLMIELLDDLKKIYEAGKTESSKSNLTLSNLREIQNRYEKRASPIESQLKVYTDIQQENSLWLNTRINGKDVSTEILNNNKTTLQNEITKLNDKYNTKNPDSYSWFDIDSRTRWSLDIIRGEIDELQSYIGLCDRLLQPTDPTTVATGGSKRVSKKSHKKLPHKSHKKSSTRLRK